MSGVAICWFLMKNNAALTAVVPAAKIAPGVIPLNTVLPAISISQISAKSRNTVAMEVTPKIVTERVQVTVECKSYPQQKQILALVRAALPHTRGAVNGFACDSIIDDIEGPDIYDDTAVIYIQSQDFIVKFTR